MDSDDVTEEKELQLNTDGDNQSTSNSFGQTESLSARRGRNKTFFSSITIDPENYYDSNFDTFETDFPNPPQTWSEGQNYEGEGDLEHRISSFQLSPLSRNQPLNPATASSAPISDLTDSASVSSSKGKYALVASGSAVTPQTRHARRIYVGGIPLNHAEEESLKNFLNSVICKCLGDDPDSTYILSIYVNQQKCFAFVELNSIELTTACLELDGILYRNSPLKILRANEYKPELLPPPSFPPIKLDTGGLLFGQSSSHLPSPSQAAQTIGLSNNDPQIDQIIKYCSVNTVQRGSIAIVGFPYDDTSRKGTVPPAIPPTVASTPTSASKTIRGCANGPRSIRTALRKFQSGSILNPEYNIDISQLKIVDVGDVQGNMTLPEAFKSLSDIIAELFQRGAIPLVIGGPSEMNTYLASGLMSISSQPIGFINVSPSIDTSLLEDLKFYYTPHSSYPSKLNCENRFLHFAAQGSSSSLENARFVSERGGRIIWYNKDIRSISYSMQPQPLSPTREVSHLFKSSLKSLNSDSTLQSQSKPVFVSVDVNSISSAFFPGQSNCRSIGLTSDEIMDICSLSGIDQNVVMLCINSFNPDVEEYRSSRLVVDMIYNFLLGITIRNQSLSARTSAMSRLSPASRNIQIQPTNATRPPSQQPMSQSKLIPSPRLSTSNFFSETTPSNYQYSQFFPASEPALRSNTSSPKHSATFFAPNSSGQGQPATNFSPKVPNTRVFAFEGFDTMYSSSNEKPNEKMSSQSQSQGQGAVSTQSQTPGGRSANFSSSNQFPQFFP